MPRPRGRPRFDVARWFKRSSRAPQLAGPAWEAPEAAARKASTGKGQGSGFAGALGLATRLGLVALFVGGGLVAIFLNTDAGETLGERLKRAAETGAVFGEPFAERFGNAAPAADEGQGGAGEIGNKTPAVAPIASSRLLTPPSPATAEDFVRLAMVSPKRLCKAIDPGEDFMAWRQSTLLQGQWECFATATAAGERVERQPDLEDGAVTEEDPDAVVEPALPDAPQLFVMARGLDRDALTTVRIKLVANGEAKAKRGGKRLAELTAALFSALQWSPPAGLLDKLQALQDFDIVQAGTRLRFKRELSDGWQYNLIVMFPNYRKYREASSFREPEAARPEPTNPGPSEAAATAVGEP
ncbi:hypothetical protein E3C22_16425 [Jiella endophytica]|uniref:Uncharacterized protein n=1 Tax=Jiella endophytica TaxID=2558362 RepID=A0A4Y8REJ2_9HYPH|nr:DUF6030 family protein [Jiella endophytica]TFF20494.1 hypothetical protein E3C22_16425 [Jiella endophytica]